MDEKITEFALEHHGSEAIVEKTAYGFLVKVKNPKGTYDKHAYVVDGEQISPLPLVAWTLSIPVKLTKEQEAIARRWQELLRYVWNDGLDLLDRFGRTHAFNAADKAWYDCCPLSLFIDGQRMPIDDSSYAWRKVGDEWQTALVCPINPKPKRAKRSPFRPRCAYHPSPETPYTVDGEGRIADRYDVQLSPGKPVLRGIDNRSLNLLFSKKANPDIDWLAEIPAQPVRAVLKELSESFSNYYFKKGGGKPRFKSGRSGDQINALVFDDANTVTRCWNDKGLLVSVMLPAFGDRKTKSGTIAIPAEYARRWGDLPIATIKLVEDCGWFLQLTTAQKPAGTLKKKETTATIEMIGKNGVLFTDSKGEEYNINLKQQLAIEAKIAGKQQHLERMRSLFTVAAIRSADLSVEIIKMLSIESKYTPALLSYLITGLDSRLKKMADLQREIKRLHRRNRLAGKARSQKLATFALRWAGKLIVIDKPHGLLLKPEPIPLEPGVWDANGAAEIARINRSRSAHRVGQFVEILKRKSTDLGREVIVDKESAKAKKKVSKKKKK